MYINYPLANKFIKMFEELDNQPRRDRMMGRTIISPTGNGKTTMIRKFVADLDERYDE